MAFVRIDWRPGRPELRRFGIAALAGAGAAGAALFLARPFAQAPAVAVAVWIAGAAAGIAGLGGTRAALAFYLPWMAVAFVTGNVFGRVALALVFFGVLTPMGLIARALGRDRLGLRRRGESTCWEDLGEPDPPQRYERRF